MGKYSNDCSCSHNANRSSNYNPYRSHENRSDNHPSRPCDNNCIDNHGENSARSRGYESEYANRSYHSPCKDDCTGRASDFCRENEYDSRACASSYVWRCSEHADCRENDNYESCPVKLHLHEVQGSTQVASCGCEAHSHRFAAVTSEPVMLKNGRHAHKIIFRTDTYEGHCHEFAGITTENYEICDGHVHYCEGKTSEQDGHCHEFKFITHIENPTED